MSEKLSESKMSSVCEIQELFQEDIAPRSVGSVKERIRHVSRRMKIPWSRAKDLWYGDRRCKPSVKEMDDARALKQEREEEAVGNELSELKERISTMEATLAAHNLHIHGQEKPSQG